MVVAFVIQVFEHHFHGRTCPPSVPARRRMPRVLSFPLFGECLAPTKVSPCSEPCRREALLYWWREERALPIQIFILYINFFNTMG